MSTIEAPATPATSTDVAPSRGQRFTGAASNYIDERTSISGAVKELGRKIFPDHWSFLLGEIALYSFVVILLTGTFFHRGIFVDESRMPLSRSISPGSDIPTPSN